ncbi:MAG: 2-oxoglutarate and iron-dependent oxygenase domain-containing protein [Pigmentiphaga sp.]|uniref:isopenicillin N synthase family dioxygenase n=1 Tax=Pigmentiphaga sp. TaxID=1977564 RepID=UPI0029AA1AE2|nr:2-oxoglutarate and iron-dependent oxygenase domain-containing protein [Pigmentiphaga sp.]MDX3906122.1 2-oxoglutarate and iron-dependent oxygenase domain-containing protein [Pigmentiphaga sp.]
MILYTPPHAAREIPVIDLADSFSPELARREAVAWKIHQACRDTGFFYVANHGIPSDVLAAQLDEARRFFAQPLEAKMRIAMAHSPCHRGYDPMRSQTLDVDSPADLKEGFQFARDLAADHPLVVSGVPNHGPNQWPDGLPGFHEQMVDYQARVIALGRHLMRCLALSLELPESYFDAGLAEPMCSVRLLHYPPHPADAGFNQLGAGAHTDWGAITLLLQDDCGGLEVRNSDGVWLRATPIPDTFVVNLGDMVRRWTNNLYQSTLHRVMNNTSGRDRYSVASFFNPEHFTRVECVPTCRPADGEPDYAPCTVGEHIAEMFRLTYGKPAMA